MFKIPFFFFFSLNYEASYNRTTYINFVTRKDGLNRGKNLATLLGVTPCGGGRVHVFYRSDPVHLSGETRDNETLTK